MSINNEERINGIAQEEPEIFGRSKSRAEIKAEEKAEKAALRQQQKDELRAIREAKKNGPKEKRPELLVMGILLAVIVISCGIALAVQFANEKKQEAYARDESFETYFLDDTAEPELNDEGITAAVNEAYYTKGGYLCVKMTLGNGLDTDQYMDSIEVQILTEEDKQIAGGYTENISKEFFVPAKGTTEYLFYISPEHVQIKDDPLTTIVYSITTTGHGVEK